jgi:hypothetical protein
MLALSISAQHDRHPPLRSGASSGFIFPTRYRYEFIMLLSLILIFLGTPVSADAIQTNCLNWFGRLIKSSFPQRNSNADITLGRGGDSVVIVYLGHHWRGPAFYPVREEVAIVSADEWLKKRLLNKRETMNGIRAIGNEPVEVSPDDFYYFGNQLKAWSITMNASDYTGWNYSRYTPFQSLIARIRERGEFLPDERITNLSPVVFRHIFVPYVRSTVRRGGRIHINLHHEDENFLRQLSILSEPDRQQKVKELINEYFSGIHHERGSLTRLELLKVASDPELFAAAIFYRNYSELIPQREVNSFWIGSGQPSFR